MILDLCSLSGLALECRAFGASHAMLKSNTSREWSNFIAYRFFRVSEKPVVGGARGIVSQLLPSFIHRSAWKDHSPKFGLG